MKKNIIFISVIFLTILILDSHSANAFIQSRDISSYDPPGFFSAIWHGLLAPYSLIARWFIDDVSIYALPNTGWFYDLGFLIGIVGSVPIGWAAAILSIIGHIFF